MAGPGRHGQFVAAVHRPLWRAVWVKGGCCYVICVGDCHPSQFQKMNCGVLRFPRAGRHAL